MGATILMVDVDGVVVRPSGRGGEDRRWDADLKADLGVDPDALQRLFFAQHWRDIALGRADLYARLRPALAEIAPHVTAAQLTAYWFGSDSDLNTALLDELAALRAAGQAMHLATVQEHHRARFLWERLDLKSRFDRMHYSADLGAAKPDRAFFARIAARTGAPPEAHLLIDDTPANVAGAVAAGWRASLWTGAQRLCEVLAAAT